ncbi:MAG: hypothetical protein GY832_46800 [Chloroflexi bacterium]|nr:hypothetical protein [Chloroflexota bacterium]
MTIQKAQWAALVYIAAHNNLENLGRRSLDQILGAGSTSQLKLTALYDRPGGTTRYIAGEPGQAAIEEPLSRFDSGDPDALLETARWAFEQCPAERYALVLWSHGSGWRPEDRAGGEFLSAWTPDELARIAREARGDDVVSVNELTQRAGRGGSMALFRTTLARILRQDDPAERAICFDDGSRHSLDMLELERVAREVQAIIGQPLDLLGMDACVMATLEVACQVRDHVRYLVASEELVPGRSWPYDTILGALRAEPVTSARDLATLVVQHYVNYYTANPPPINGGDVTKVALDLAQIDGLIQAAGGLGEALLHEIDSQADHLWAAQRETQQKEQWKRLYKYTKFYYHLWDIGTLAERLVADSDNAAVRDAARGVNAALQPGGAVIAKGHRGDWFDGIGGVSIYAVPPGVQRVSPYYDEVAFVQSTRWGEMLAAYHEALA